uniref:RING-type domain-containing protein n=1 Tax=Timema shepardi TaxID=629360 RepID=A0A7R9B6A9_TIMSH|nr:unnamed protein product [Timema shepardi]
MIEQTALSNDTIRKRIHDMSIDITRQVMLFSDDTQLRAYIRSAAPTVMKEGVHLHAVVAALSVLGVLRARQGHCDVIMRRHGDVFFDVQVQPLHKGLLCRTPSLGRISLLSAPVSTGADPSCLPLHQKGLREIMTDDKILESVVDEQQGDKEEDDETDEGMEDETVPMHGENAEVYICLLSSACRILRHGNERLLQTATRMRRCTTGCCQAPAGSCGTETSDFSKRQPECGGVQLLAVKRLQDLAARKRATSPKQRMLFEMFQVLECRVCEDVFGLQGDKVPRLLYCGHTVCHACLLRLPLRDNMVQCPFDRQPTPTGKATNIIYYNVNSDWLQTEGGGYHFISPPIYYCNEWQSRETERHGMAWEETGELAKWAGTTEQYGI